MAASLSGSSSPLGAGASEALWALLEHFPTGALVECKVPHAGSLRCQLLRPLGAPTPVLLVRGAPAAIPSPVRGYPQGSLRTPQHMRQTRQS